MASPAPEPVQRKLLLVEGDDDRRLFSAMSLHLAISGIEISSYNGKPNLGNDLSERVRNPDFQTVTSLGIVRDADNSSQSAFHSAVGSLRRAKLPTPDAPMVPTEQDGLRIAILILPPDEDMGELENVCLSSIQATPDMQCADSYITCINNAEPPIATNRIAKARLHSYLAIGPVHTTNDGNITRRRPALRLGEAAEAGVWDWSSAAFQQIEDFLRNL